MFMVVFQLRDGTSDRDVAASTLPNVGDVVTFENLRYKVISVEHPLKDASGYYPPDTAYQPYVIVSRIGDDTAYRG